MSLMGDVIRGGLGIEGKALRAGDYAVADPGIYGNPRGKRIGPGIAGRHLSAYGGNNAVDRVMTNVRLIMETASSADYHFEKVSSGKVVKTQRDPGDDGRSVEQADKALVELIEAPNPWFQWVDLLELTIIDLLLVGDAFWLKFRIYDDGKPLALYRLAPQFLTVVPGKSRLVEKYEYEVPGEPPLSFKPEEVVHFKLPNPHNPYKGLGIMEGGPRVYDAELNLTETTASFYERGARWLGLILADRTVTRESLKKLRRIMQGLYSGPGNSGTVPILERGMTWQSISGSAADAGLAEMSKMSLKRIDSHFRTSKLLFGDLEGADVKAAREAQRIFDTKTMRPLLNRLQRTISLSVTRAWGLDFKIDYEYTMAPEDALDLAAGLGTLPGIRVREVREAALLDPLGDERDDWVLNLPGENDNESDVKDLAMGGEAGRPPKAENTRKFPDDALVSRKPGPQPGPISAKPGGRPSQRAKA
jgi:HK97 family phage portal protein